MGEQPKSNCHNDCGSGLYMPAGTGKVKGFGGAKGNKFKCMRCGTEHIFNDRGEFLGFAK